MRKPQIRERIHEFIRHSFDEKGYAPTVRDIMRGCNISSTSLVQYHLNILEKEGHIHRDPEVFRSIQLAEKDIIEVPLLGTIAAGEPIPVVDSGTWIRMLLLSRVFANRERRESPIISKAGHKITGNLA